MKQLLGLLGLLVLFMCLHSVQAEEKRSELTELSFGVVPQQAARKLARLWNPILSHVSEKTGLSIRFKTAPNIPEFEKRLARGEYDLAYMNPYHYTVFQRSPGYRALAKQKGKLIRGIIVVRKDSPIESLEELAGKTLAFPAPAAFAASILTRGYLASNNIAFTARYVSSHDSVYRSVAKGLYAAGGGIERTFNNVAPNVREQLRILWTSAPYTPHAIAAHPRVAEQIAMQITDVLIHMDQNEAGQALLASINFKGIENAADSDWDDVRALRLDLLDDLATAE